MIRTIPLSALELGISHEDYTQIAESIKEIGFFSQEQRDKIQEKAKRELSKKTLRQTHKLVVDLAYDREVYEIAGISYDNGPPEGKNIFTTAVDYYLLKKHPFKQTN